MNFDISFLRDIKTQSTSKKRGFEYKDIICTFDIEATNDSETANAFMYSWMLYFSHYAVCMGRTWDEFLELLEDIDTLLDDNERLCVFVHNLSYEFSFMKGVMEFPNENVFAVRPRKILLCKYGKLEFRCSYLHSNMALSKFTEKMCVKHKKMSGDEYDYDKQRYPWTPLDDLEMCYQLCDVIGLAEAIEAEMISDKDDFYSLPYTSTGYVRRDAKDVLRELVNSVIYPIYPNEHIYELCREEFRGGDTHANRYYVGMVLKGPIHCFDYSSEYPSAMLTRKYPVKPFREMGNLSAKQVYQLINSGKAILARIALKKVKLKDEKNGFPYLSLSKCRNVLIKRKNMSEEQKKILEEYPTILDNGRILETYYLETTVNDIDLKIILEDYAIEDIIFIDVAYSSYGNLPSAYKKLIIHYFDLKTKLKGDAEQSYFYDKAKNKLNSLYGMMVQDPGRPPIIFNQHPEDDEDLFSLKKGSVLRFLLEYKKKAFLAYQWGIWVTAWGRWMLHEARKCCNPEDIVYCDTDSIKGFMGGDCFIYLNRRNKSRAIDNNAWAENDKGKKYYMGVLEQEDDYNEFITWGAKKYAYTDDRGKLHITIAGVNKAKGAKELEKSGGIEKLKLGYKFKTAGGPEAVYNDNVDFWIEREGKMLRITDNVYLKNGEYTLGIASEYATLLDLI